MKKTIGILAHVDAGKTTFSEQLLYHTNSIRTRGRVDYKNSYLDNHNIERSRGITVFSHDAIFNIGESTYYLLDTPGHVDFSTEMERTISMLDYAILIISAVEGIQGHTETVWNILKKNKVPTFIFINKIDRVGAEVERVIKEIKTNFSNKICFIDNSLEEELSEEVVEGISENDEELIEKYLNGEYSKDEWIKALRNQIKECKIYPVFSGSALQDIGMKEFIYALDNLTYTSYDNEGDFKGTVYKVKYDEDNKTRITFIKCTNGKLKVRDEIKYKDKKDKVSNIRIYNGEKFKSVNSVEAGDIFGVAGITELYPGETIGDKKENIVYDFIPIMVSKVIFNDDINAKEVFSYFKILNSEDPLLNVTWVEEFEEINVHIMGRIQTEVLKEIVKERFNLDIEFGPCNILYKETIKEKAIGSGHFEPLRHYAEVHLLMEPNNRDKGITFENKCHSDNLNIGQMNLVKTHVFEREHRGILTGSPITDIKFTLLTGKAHLKHTSGGDFREATYRAIRQGLEQVENILLEPYYRFKISADIEYMGRIISDIQRLSGSFNAPEQNENKVVIQGRGPVSKFMDYSNEFNAFTKGKGSISLIYDGYDKCHNWEDVIESRGYNKDADIEYTSTSIFCSKGQGYLVKWDKVKEEVHCDLEGLI
ncbi:MAG: TetM/TetW/TetO/TetS family tetracycline resistance ribosomal protection protein [Clostridium sp.]|uniref:translation factor GTPase family protein n=1 Tax=Clostridium sp. TaxID=1506 RepID=UPI00290D9DA9|nr:translation factor GTPase family protein [Clostridium sp.]MDU4939094.1 TetM/TetW/TetO/TetS family tetracycline resistance ribosomal protection protein [Clostridium sp.]